jgi:hypothetical protein
MQQLATGVLGAVAISLALGAVQLASGRDLSTAQDRLQSSSPEALAANGMAVNRAAKADRAAGISGSPAQTRTISLKLDGFADTSFLLRLPVASAARDTSSAKSRVRKMVACEPVVSVLTEVARMLQPGRCVT